MYHRRISPNTPFALIPKRVCYPRTTCQQSLEGDVWRDSRSPTRATLARSDKKLAHSERHVALLPPVPVERSRARLEDSHFRDATLSRRGLLPCPSASDKARSAF